VLVYIAVAIVAAGAYFFLHKNDPQYANVGQCVNGSAVRAQDVNNLTVVDCNSGDVFKVVQKFDSVNKSDADKACTDQTTQYWLYSSDTDTGTVFCLAPVTK
jgi:hypothetical protein